jgi:hypothetical protein
VHRFHPFQSPVEVTPLPTDLDVGLIHPPGTCRHHRVCLSSSGPYFWTQR